MSEFKLCKIFDDADSAAEFVGKRWRSYQKKYTKKGLFLVSSPLSSTPLPLYKYVIENAESFENWDRFRFVLMDEQVDANHESSYVPLADSASYERFAREKLLNHLRNYVGSIDKTILKPSLQNLEDFDKIIEEHNGIDLLILATGAKGHYAQVMPRTALETGFHISSLIPEFSEAHTKKSGGHYEGAKFRQYGMSLGPKQVLSAKNIILLITGESKKELAKQLFSYNSFNPEFPISIVHHPQVRNKAEIVLSKDVGYEI